MVGRSQGTRTQPSTNDNKRHYLVPIELHRVNQSAPVVSLFDAPLLCVLHLELLDLTVPEIKLIQACLELSPQQIILRLKHFGLFSQSLNCHLGLLLNLGQVL